MTQPVHDAPRAVPRRRLVLSWLPVVQAKTGDDRWSCCRSGPSRRGASATTDAVPRRDVRHETKLAHRRGAWRSLFPRAF